MNRQTNLQRTRSAVQTLSLGALILAPFVLGSVLEAALLGPVGGAA